jgi:hypothetical protein
MKRTFWLLPLFASISSFAVTPSFWETRSYDEFRKGKFTGLSLTSEDQLILAPAFNMVFNTQQPLIWSAAADSKGNLYLGTGHDGKIFKVDAAGKGDLLATLSEIDVLALTVDKNDVLYAATSPDGKVYKIQSGRQPAVFFEPHTKYIWSLVFDKQGRLIVGTGDKGVIYRVAPDGKGETFYETDETHIISLAVDNDGNVIAGGDPKGYIYRISPEGKAFVLYDSGLREVHALSVAPDGRIYAAVVNGSGGFSPASSPAAPPGGTTSGGDGTIRVTLDAAATAVGQNIDVIDSGDSSDSQRGGSGRSGAGSARSVILEILPNGAVNTLIRSRDEMVYSLLPHNGRLLFSTGTKGRIYALEGDRNATLLLESTEEQTTRLLAVENRVYATSANAGKLFSMGDALASTGSYESTVRDTNAISTWGRLSWKAQSADLIQFFTRSGNTSAPDKTWSDWAAVSSNGATSSPNARFLQWKAVLNSDRSRSPILDSVTVPYLQQNFKPEVTSLEVLPPGVALVKIQQLNSAGNPVATDAASARANARTGQPPAPKIPPRHIVQKGAQSFQWNASDRNQDALQYDLYYRGESERSWKLLKKDLEDTFYTINSDTLPDGVYVARIVASDLPSNPAALALTGEMESRPFTIDNTPPTVAMKQESVSGGRVRIAIDAADATSTLNQAEIAVDTGDWRVIFPQDGIIDSKAESFVYQTDILPPGEHVIAFRIYDQVDNVGLGKLVVRIP